MPNILPRPKILKEEDETKLLVEEMKERKIMWLLLKFENGTLPACRTALKQITDKAQEFGASPLFDKILPLLMEHTLEDQEHHLLVKVHFINSTTLPIPTSTKFLLSLSPY